MSAAPRWLFGRSAQFMVRCAELSLTGSGLQPAARSLAVRRTLPAPSETAGGTHLVRPILGSPNGPIHPRIVSPTAHAAAMAGPQSGPFRSIRTTLRSWLGRGVQIHRPWSWPEVPRLAATGLLDWALHDGVVFPGGFSLATASAIAAPGSGLDHGWSAARHRRIPCQLPIWSPPHLGRRDR